MVFCRKVISLFLLFLLVLTSCDNSTRKQDDKFVHSIKSQLKNVSDFVKVSDLYPGEWSKVCFARCGIGKVNPLKAVAEYANIGLQDIVVINRKKSDVRYVNDFDWGIYFFTAPNEVEYFLIKNSQMLPRPDDFNVDDYGCVTNDKAYFFVRSIHMEKKTNKERYYLGLTNSKPKEKRK